MNLEVAAEHAVQPYTAAKHRLNGFVHAHRLVTRPYALFGCLTFMPFQQECMLASFGVQNA